MSKQDFEKLSRREREVMYVCHRHERVSAKLLQKELQSEISNSNARRFLSILKEKGFLSVQKVGVRYFYSPVVDNTEAGIALLKSTFGSFFGGSAVLGIANFVRREGRDMDKRELAYLEKLIQDAKEEGR